MNISNIFNNTLCCCAENQPRKRIISRQLLAPPGDIPGCVFCDIRSGRDPDVGKILHTDDRVFVLPDKYPAAHRHLLVLPTRHVGTVKDLRAGCAEDIELGMLW